MAITKRIDKGSSLTYQEMDDNLEAIAPRTSATGSLQIPAGTTAQRDGSPTNGYLRYNTSLNVFEGYINGGWGGLGGGGGSGDPNQNAFSQIAVSGQTNIDADTATDTLNIAAGSNITLTTNASTDTLTISASFTQNFAWSALTGTPTTVAGYGITDAQELLVSGTNIRTVNGNSLLGSGDISLTASTDWASITNKPNTIAGFGIIDAFDGAWSSLTGTPTTVSGYGITDAQEILVSGTNIKTINGVSVLGTGDLTVTGTYGDLQVSAHLNTNSANSGDYLTWNGSDFAWVAGGGGGGSETDPVVGAVTGIVKSDGGGNITAAVAGTDYSTFDEQYSSLQGHPTDLLTAGFSNASLLELVDVVNGGGANGQILTSNGNGQFSFQDAPTGGAGGTTTFLGLTDTPSSYSAGQLVAVNSSGNGLEFIPQSAGGEVNDLTQSVTWDIVPDAYIANTSVVQHQTDLRLTLSQITDFDANNYIASEDDPIFRAHTTYNIVNGSGFLRQDGAGNWFYDSNTYLTQANSVPETDPVFTAHTTYNIINGTGRLQNDGSGNWSYDNETYLTSATLVETDPVFSAHTTASIQNGSGFLKQDGAGNWFYDSNTYLTTAGSFTETDPIFTAHTTYNVTDGSGYLKNDGLGNWSYEANTFLTTETDPVFTAHPAYNISDGEGFLRQDNANNWYWDSNTYITAADVTTPTLNLDDVTTNGGSTTNSVEVGALTVGGVNVIIEGSNNALLTNGAAYITLTDLSVSGDLAYDNTTGVFSANLQSTGISLNDLSANNAATPSGNGSISYDNTTGVFTYTPPDLSALGGGAETDPTFTASAVANVVASATDGFLRNVGGEWYYDTNTYLTAAASETDPVFTAHTTFNIADGTGFLQNDGSGNWSYSNGSVTETDPVFSAWTGSSIVDGTGRLQNDGTGTWTYDNTVYVANGQNISDLNNDAGYITGYTETNDLTAAVVWTSIPDAYVPASAVTQHENLLTIGTGQLTGSYTTNNNIILYKQTDGDVNEGTLILESRDLTPTIDQSMGDILFRMDTDANAGTYTAGNYAQISAKAAQVATGGNHHGYLEFLANNGSRGFEKFMEMGVDPFDHDGTPNPAFVGTRHVRPFYGENIVSCISEVSVAGDMTSDTPISFFLGAYDSSTGNYHTRGVLIHTENELRIDSHDATGNTNFDYSRLTLVPTLSNTALQFSSSVDGVVTDYTVAGTHNLQYIFDNNTINTVNANNIVITTGVAFSNTGGSGTSTSNTLDSYEEGTWTPTLADGAGNTYTSTYTIQKGRYTRIGNLVTVTCYILTTGGVDWVTTGGLNATSDMLVTGLPFTIGAAGDDDVYGHFHGSPSRQSANYTDRGTWGVGNTTQVQFVEYDSSGTFAANIMVVSDFNTTNGRSDGIRFTLQYFTGAA